MNPVTSWVGVFIPFNWTLIYLWSKTLLTLWGKTLLTLIFFLSTNFAIGLELIVHFS